MPRLTRRSAASKEEVTPEADENSRTTSRSRRGAKKEEPKQEEVAVGEPQETPTKRGGRQTTKAKQTEPKEVTPKKGKSPAGGRSTSRSKKGNKQEESEEEPEQEQADEEVEEEHLAKGGSRSRGRGSKGTAKGGRATGGKAEEEIKETDKLEEEKEVEDTSDAAAKTPASKNKGKSAATTRGGRKPRGKAGAEPAEEEKEEPKEEDSKGEKEESEAVADIDVSAEPKGRLRRGQNQTPEAVGVTPPSGGKRGRGQKQTESSSKTPPSRTSRRGVASAAEDESKEKEEVGEPMETTEEELKSPEETEPLKDTTELKEAEEEPNKKRKLEVEDDRQVKRSRTEEEENAEESKKEDLEDFVVVNKEELPPPESKEVLDSLPPPVSSVPESSKPAEDEPKPPSADVLSPIETSDSSFVVPLTEAELAKQYSQRQKLQDVDETSSTLVEVGSEAASDITGLSRGLDFSDTVSQDASVTAEQSDQPMEDVSSEDPLDNLNKDGEVSKEGAVEKQTTVEAESTDPAVEQNSGALDRYTPSSPDILNRKFILNPLIPPDLMDPAYCFSLVSYNILADCHLQRGDYSYRKPQFLEQDYRHFVLMKEMDYLDGDIVCMQEVNPKYYHDVLLPAMASRGYEGSFMKRTKDYWDEGAATFVRKSKFTVVSSQGLSLRDLAYKGVDSFNLSAEVSEAAKKYLDRADVVLLTQVKLNKTSQVITVCNIHVVYDIHALDVQCIQVACAVKELVSKAGSDLNPHIICGDFNSLFSSPGYQLARDGYLVDTNIKKLQAIQALELTDDSASKAIVNHMWGAFQHTSSNLQSAYQAVMSREPLCTTYTKSSYGTLDYIFYSSLSLNVIGVQETVDDYVVRNSGGLPTSSIPSDHLSLKAVFRPREEKN
ncbi:hypothetical protein Btru_055090 [Bulinus truncatus]|nr:hypothetical protein Btru_055090 [Bulinus truncatus]